MVGSWLFCFVVYPCLCSVINATGVEAKYMIGQET